MKTYNDIAQLFINWTKKKIQHHIQEDATDLFYHEGQIWWAALGQNIGFEMGGKSEEFHRPVLILRKYNARMCFVVPLTTQIKNPPVWYQISVSGSERKRAANITQGRTMSTKRLLHKDSTLEPEEFALIQKVFREQFI
ncbi:MAG: type II toxin-antitoxin system PemK/MazF family toxin [Bacteroidota bacterium]